MFDEVAAYGAVVAAIAYLGRRLFAAVLPPALARRWPALLRRHGPAPHSRAEPPAAESRCSGCCGCSSAQRPQPHRQVLIAGRRGTQDR